MANENPVTQAINMLGLAALSRAVGITHQNVRKWERIGMPRTEWTGETDYASVIERETGGLVTRAMLLVTRR